MTIPTILEDPRTIVEVRLSADMAYTVGMSDVTAIRAYGEPGANSPLVPFFAVLIGHEVVARVPAWFAIITYAEAPPIQ